MFDIVNLYIFLLVVALCCMIACIYQFQMHRGRSGTILFFASVVFLASPFCIMFIR